MTRREYKAKRKTQIMWGIVMLIATVIILTIAASGTTTETRDATATLFTAPLGLYLTFTKKIIID